MCCLQTVALLEMLGLPYNLDPSSAHTSVQSGAASGKLSQGATCHCLPDVYLVKRCYTINYCLRLLNCY